MYDPKAYSPSGLSIAAFILGILSFVGCGPCFGLPALIMGLIELQNIKKHISSAEGRGFALAGTILGGISLAISLLIALVYLIFVLIAVLAGASGNNF